MAKHTVDLFLAGQLWWVIDRLSSTIRPNARGHKSQLARMPFPQPCTCQRQMRRSRRSHRELSSLIHIFLGVSLTRRCVSERTAQDRISLRFPSVGSTTSMTVERQRPERRMMTAVALSLLLVADVLGTHPHSSPVSLARPRRRVNWFSTTTGSPGVKCGSPMPVF